MSSGAYLENYEPLKIAGGFKTKLPVTLSGTSANLSVGGTLAVTGNSTLSGTLAVTGAITATGGVTGQSFVVNYIGQTTEAATDRVIFTAPVACQVTAAYEVHAVAAGGASALQVTKDTGTTAPGAGTDLLTNNTNTGFDLNATANTVQTGTLTGTVASLQLAVGDRLAIDFANTIQLTAGLNVVVLLKTI
jgi:hypothetical protein